MYVVSLSIRGGPTYVCPTCHAGIMMTKLEEEAIIYNTENL